MARIIVNNPRQVINGGAKKYYFKVKGLGGPKGNKGDKGDTGGQGPQGPQGNAATISVGSTTTLPVGYNATVENVGSIYNAVLNFGIPQGPRGPQGATGAKGDKGDKGEQGNPGPQGEKGTNATVTVGTTTTTEPGTQAYAWNSSSNPNNAVINFNIPRGATGSQGPQGVQGPTGPAGADGESFTPVVVSSLPATGDESKLYLTPKNYTTQTATGNPITATITEQAGAIESFQLDGDTFQQSYEGKNLCGIPDQTFTRNGVTFTFKDGELTLNGTINGLGTIYIAPVKTTHLNGSYVVNSIYVSGTSTAGGGTNFNLRSASDNTIISGSQCNLITEDKSKAVSVEDDDIVFGIYLYPNGAVFENFKVKLQIVSGSTADYDFEPYVGGTASPNPDYPQPIQTVTGLQTITINGTDYPIDLGDIQLCGLGDEGAGGYLYKDGVYKNLDDGKWYVHKAVRKQAMGDITGYTKGSGGTDGTRWLRLNFATAYNAVAGVTCISNCLLYKSATQWSGDAFGIAASGNLWIGLDNAHSSLSAWLSSIGAVMYYPLATPTDTEITDTTLIAQLEAIRTASLQNGTNTITNTATGDNLAGDMEIGYYGYNPRNRYDKWLWLDINNEYEQIGS
jgi:hypothetical protein